jgi:hypothetical protein
MPEQTNQSEPWTPLVAGVKAAPETAPDPMGYGSSLPEVSRLLDNTISRLRFYQDVLRACEDQRLEGHDIKEGMEFLVKSLDSDGRTTQNVAFNLAAHFAQHMLNPMDLASMSHDPATCPCVSEDERPRPH